MMKPERSNIPNRRAMGGAIFIAFLVSLPFLLRADPVPATAPTSQATPIGFAPLTYFNDRCGNCHGNYASFAGNQFGAKEAKEGTLREIVKSMAAGPAQSPLTEPEIDILTAYHRSILDGGPFIAVTTINGQALAGEATPDSTIELVIDEKSTPVALKGHQWTIELPPGVNLSSVTLVATLSGRKTTLFPGESLYSHR